MINSLAIGLLGIEKFIYSFGFKNYCISRPTSNLDGFFSIVASHILCASALLALAAAYFSARVCIVTQSPPMGEDAVKSELTHSCILWENLSGSRADSPSIEEDGSDN